MPRPEHLAGLDAVVCDLPDVGSRYYTFIWTTALVMKACAAQGIPVFVLDRPNPLGGLAVEGNLPEERLLSFVGLWPVPPRHGMTPGEVARYVNAEFAFGCDLTVVPMKLAGSRGAAPRGRVGETPAWVLPSPNMPSRDTALVYPGMCLLEGTNLSEARGTTRPFEIVGAPWLDAERRRGSCERPRPAGRRLPAARLPSHVPQVRRAGLRRRPAARDPTQETFRPYETGLRLVKLLRDLDPLALPVADRDVRIPERRPGRRPPRGDAAVPRARRRGREPRSVDRHVPGRRRALRADPREEPPLPGRTAAGPRRRRPQVGEDDRRRRAHPWRSSRVASRSARSSTRGTSTRRTPRERLAAALRRGGEPGRPPHRPAVRRPRAPRRAPFAGRRDRPRDAARRRRRRRGFPGRPGAEGGSLPRGDRKRSR